MNENEAAQTIFGCGTLLAIISSGPIAGALYSTVYDGDFGVSTLICFAVWVFVWILLLVAKK